MSLPGLSAIAIDGHALAPAIDGKLVTGGGRFASSEVRWNRDKLPTKLEVASRVLRDDPPVYITIGMAQLDMSFECLVGVEITATEVTAVVARHTRLLVSNRYGIGVELQGMRIVVALSPPVRSQWMVHLISR